MKIALCEFSSLWQDVPSSIARCDLAVDEFIASHGPADIIAFPEFFTTGFTFDKAYAEDFEGMSLSWLVEKAAQIGCAMAASIPFRDGNIYVNRLFFVYPDGSLFHYDKRHPFSYSGEGEVFTGGGMRQVVEYKGWRIFLSVCYDLRFPVWMRSRNLEYDLLLNVAAWPAGRVEAAQALLRARAIENQCCAAFCNRTGSDPNAHYCESSLVCDWYGKEISNRVYLSSASFVVAQLNMEDLSLYRASFPAYRDSDSFVLG